jgi:hypothetical protein
VGRRREEPSLRRRDGKQGRERENGMTEKML